MKEYEVFFFEELEPNKPRITSPLSYSGHNLDIRLESEDVINVTATVRSNAITVPFNAITQFADQSVQFGFKLNPIPPSKKEKTDTKNKPSNNQVIDLESFRKK